MPRATLRLLAVVVAVTIAGCASTSSSRPQGLPETADAPPDADTEPVAEVETVAESTAGFDYEGRRYELSCGVIKPDLVEPAAFATSVGDLGGSESLHRIRGVDPAVLLAVPNDGLCNLAPGQAWQSAFAAQELRGNQPSAALAVPRGVVGFEVDPRCLLAAVDRGDAAGIASWFLSWAMDPSDR